MQIAIVGRGLIGAAAARHLAKDGHDVTLIGPGEPPGDWAAHQGPFASHYDEGRITRTIDRRPYYVAASAAAIARYGEIEAESGIGFFTEAGGLIAAGPGYMAEVAAACAGVPHETFDADGLRARFPFLRFPASQSGAYEATGAGYVSPRRLVAAQVEAATRHGAHLLAEAAKDIAPGRVTTASRRIGADCVIVAAGGWTDTLLGRPNTITVRPRTVALFEIGPAEAERLRGMPSIVWETPNGAYILPPIRYPDGKLWLKIGGDPVDYELTSRAEIDDWFRGGGAEDVHAYQTAQIRELIPGLAFESTRMAPCVTSWTDSGTPEIATLSPGLVIAAGGNGAAAKCSDELGRRAAVLALGG